jgi:hypothetical protein
LEETVQAPSLDSVSFLGFNNPAEHVDAAGPVIDECDIYTCTRETRQLTFDLAGVPKIVRIQRRDELPIGIFDTGVSGAGYASLRRRDNADAGISGTIGIAQRESAVRRTVVNDDYFQIRMSLLKRGLDRFRNGRLCIVRRNYYAN